jgi:hypothetical protein
MKTAFLTRIRTSREGTFGKLAVDNLAFFTGELPWRNNRLDDSCIPEGRYLCSWTFSRHFNKNLYLLDEVSGRSGIRIHSANFMGDSPLKKQLNGCIALGDRLGEMDGQQCLLLSFPAVQRFEKYMNKENFQLEVMWTS